VDCFVSFCHGQTVRVAATASTLHTFPPLLTLPETFWLPIAGPRRQQDGANQEQGGDLFHHRCPLLLNDYASHLHYLIQDLTRQWWDTKVSPTDVCKNFFLNSLAFPLPRRTHEIMPLVAKKKTFIEQKT